MKKKLTVGVIFGGPAGELTMPFYGFLIETKNIGTV